MRYPATMTASPSLCVASVLWATLCACSPDPGAPQAPPTTPASERASTAPPASDPEPASAPTESAPEECDHAGDASLSAPPSGSDSPDVPASLRGIFRVADETPEAHGDRIVPRGLEHIETGLIFLYVPAGTFTFGSDADDPDRFDDERPPRRVHVGGFYLSATETTLDAWRRGGGETGSGLGDRHPVTGINWFEAREWCVDNALALPTEAQWEYAASGPRNSRFPWGYDPRVRGRANVADTNSDDLWQETAPVESFPEGTSWCGVADLAGNVMEWCRDGWTPDHAQVPPGATDPVLEPAQDDPQVERLVRGGSFETDSLIHLRCAYRNALLPSLAGSNLGFRAVIPGF